MGYPAKVVQKWWFARPSWQCVVAVLLLPGCRDVLGVTGYEITRPDASFREAGNTMPSASGEAGSTPPSSETAAYKSKYGPAYTNASCGMCMDERCAAEADDCSKDPGCVSLEECLASCGGAGDDGCRVTCNLGTRRTRGMSELMACAAQHCSQCAAALATYGDRVCTQCFEGPEQRALLERFSRSAAALELDSCRQDCPSASGQECLCNDIYRFGKQPTVARAGSQGSRDAAAPTDAARDAGNAEDVLDAVTAAAGVGGCGMWCNNQDWSCLDTLKPPPDAPRDQTEFDLHVEPVDVGSQQPILGALVARCFGVVANCSAGTDTPVAVQSDGFATLHMTRPSAGLGSAPFFNAIEVDWDDGNDPSTVLLYFYPPLTRSPSWVWRRLVSKTVADKVVEGLKMTDRLDEYGGIVWSVATCNGLAAQKVEATLSPADGHDASAERSAYYADKNWALDPMLPYTSESGLGAFVNVPEDKWILTLSVHGNKGLVGKYPVYVRKGAITTLSLKPYRDPDLL